MVRPLDGRAVSGAARALTRHTTWVVAACTAAAVTAAVVPPVLGPQSGQLASGLLATAPSSSLGSSSTASPVTAPVTSPSASALVADDEIVTAGRGTVGQAATAQRAAFTGAAGDIPASALQAYQRAAVVINAAIPTCKIQWQLLAAVGRVESNHGQAGGNTVGADGVAKPGIFGPVLNGRSGTTRVGDTDGGRFDDDAALDRAVGPMQFIPSTWAVVGVDADGDGKRNPQDIDDAALAAAVYLCGGQTDLSTDAGQRTAIYRYNHSDSYVATVQSIMRAYLGGDFSSDPVVIAPLPVTVPATVAPQQTPYVSSVRHAAQNISQLTATSVSAVDAAAPVVAAEPLSGRPVTAAVRQTPATDPVQTETGPTETETPDPADTESESTESEASEPAETESTEPAEVEPSEPAEVEPSEPAEVEPSEPAEVEPSEPAESESTEPAESESTEPAESESTEPAESESTEPAESEASEPAEVEPSQPAQEQSQPAPAADPCDAVDAKDAADDQCDGADGDDTPATGKRPSEVAIEPQDPVTPDA